MSDDVDDDRQAILSRRTFLIEAALANAGLAAACKDDAGVCLNVAAPQKPKPKPVPAADAAAPKAKDTTATATTKRDAPPTVQPDLAPASGTVKDAGPDRPEPQPPPKKRTTPKVCLKVAPPKKTPEPPPRRPPKKTRPSPRPCLKIAPRRDKPAPTEKL